MNAIQNFFLRARHWQIFLPVLACWCLGTVATLRSMASADPFGNLLPFLVAMEVSAAILAAWLWSIGEMLGSAIPSALMMNVSFFRFAVALLPFYFPIFAVFFVGLNMRLSASLVLASSAVIVLLHFLAMFCQLYSWYFVSKSLVLAERLRPVRFSDYQAALLGLWFFPVGIWFIQPRINRLYAKRVAIL